jgi:RND family efflux transporter MFP subunit
MAKHRLRLSIAVIAGALVFFGAFTAAWLAERGRREAPPEVLPVPVRVTRVRRMDLSRVYRVSGHVEAEQTVTLLPKIEGAVTSLPVAMGDRIEKGALVAEIDPEPYRLYLRRAEANLDAARSAYQRVSTLFEANSISAQKYDEAKAAFDAAESARDIARLQWENSRVTAPLEGAVVQVHVAEGDLVSPSRPLATIADISRLKVDASVPENYYERFLRAPGEIGISVEAASLPGRFVPGAIRAVAPAIDPRSRSFRVSVDLDFGDEPLRPGMYVQLYFILETREDVNTLPYSALVSGRTLWTVEDGHARRVDFSPVFTGAERFQVPPEFEDRQFIVEGHHFLQEGQKVKVVGN